MIAPSIGSADTKPPANPTSRFSVPDRTRQNGMHPLGRTRHHYLETQINSLLGREIDAGAQVLICREGLPPVLSRGVHMKEDGLVFRPAEILPTTDLERDFIPEARLGIACAVWLHQALLQGRSSFFWMDSAAQARRARGELRIERPASSRVATHHQTTATRNCQQAGPTQVPRP